MSKSKRIRLLFFVFRLFVPASLLWAKHTLLYQQVNAGRHSLFRLICFVSRIWMIHANFPLHLFRLIAPASLLWAKHTLLYQQVNAGRYSLFHLICFVSRIWMIHTCFPIQVSLASTTVVSHIILLLILVHAVIRLVDRFLHILSGF